MLRKITAISLIIMFGIITAAPFIHSDDCTNSCCVEVEMSCCEMEKEITCPTMSDCGTTVFVPIVSGPFHKSLLKSIDAVSNIAVQNSVFPAFIIQAFLHRIHADPGPIAHLNLTLLI